MCMSVDNASVSRRAQMAGPSGAVSRSEEQGSIHPLCPEPEHAPRRWRRWNDAPPPAAPLGVSY